MLLLTIIFFSLIGLIIEIGKNYMENS